MSTPTHPLVTPLYIHIVFPLPSQGRHYFGTMRMGGWIPFPNQEYTEQIIICVRALQHKQGQTVWFMQYSHRVALYIFIIVLIYGYNI